MTENYPCFASVNAQCVSDFISKFASRAYRRSLQQEEVDELIQFYDSQVGDGNTPVEARIVLVQRILMSPNFLYKTEIGQSSIDGKFLNDFEKASFISYAITGNMPDDLLFADASSGTLTYDKIKGHVDRILKTAESQAWMTFYFRQWLGVEGLDAMAANADIGSSKLESAAQGRALSQEFDHFIDTIIFKNQGSLSELFSTNKGFVNRHTASIYGKTSTSDGFEAVEFDPSERSGILTLSSFLAAHSSEGDISNDQPMVRGSFIFENIMCQDVGVPSGLDTNAAAEGALSRIPNFDELTTREQSEAILSQGDSCIQCHANFMPYGYAMSNYDGLGAWRVEQKERLVDAAVPIAKVDGSSSSYSNMVEISQALSQSKDLHSCFAENFLIFAAGESYSADFDYLRQLGGYHLMNKEDGNIFSMMREVLSSPEIYERQ